MKKLLLILFWSSLLATTADAILSQVKIGKTTTQRHATSKTTHIAPRQAAGSRAVTVRPPLDPSPAPPPLAPTNK